MCIRDRINWIRTTISGKERIKTKGAAEILIKRRLATIKQLIEELGINLKLEFVPSEKNKADSISRIRRKWLIGEENKLINNNVCLLSFEELKELHNRHHQGIEKTLFLARICLLYTSDAADERSSVDLGGRRI